MKILVINCGSSSLKYQFIDMNGEHVLFIGIFERIGMDVSVISHDKRGVDIWVNEVPLKDLTDAIAQVL
ncbi:MAG: acetate kinase, partial [Anaerovoracaceae bacterium]|nr:acetate kinase [Anaerovoracaceae bacterium]